MAVPPDDTPSLPDPGFALYVHWPFCRAKCPYCDFNSHVRPAIDEAAWCQALVAEVDHWAARTGRRRLDSIFFGGGTPSLMPPAVAAAVIDRVASLFDLPTDAEITLEANPTSVEAGRLAGFRTAGVNRVSLGVQALDDADLKALGREHTAAEALAAVELAASLFPRHSFDLIYARPAQTVAAWEAELTRALTHADGHLSVYQLTIEPGTRFHALHASGALVVPDEDLQAELYEVTQAVLQGAGLPAYEISNHARPGRESRHNLVYWRSGEWIGVGPGAHGRLALDGARTAVANTRAPERWLAQVRARGHGVEGESPVPARDQCEELLMMGLRLVEGVSIARLERLAGAPAETVVDDGALSRLAAGGFVALEDDRLRATPAGRQRLEAVLRALLT